MREQRAHPPEISFYSVTTAADKRGAGLGRESAGEEDCKKK
jgi:hypothetical protein